MGTGALIGFASLEMDIILLFSVLEYLPQTEYNRGEQLSDRQRFARK